MVEWGHERSPPAWPITSGRPNANNSRTVLAAGVGTGGRTASAGSGVLVVGGTVGVTTGVCSAGSSSTLSSSAATGVAAVVAVGAAVGASVGGAVGNAAGVDDAVACSTLGALSSAPSHPTSSALSRTSANGTNTITERANLRGERRIPKTLGPKFRMLRQQFLASTAGRPRSRRACVR